MVFYGGDGSGVDDGGSYRWSDSFSVGYSVGWSGLEWGSDSHVVSRPGLVWSRFMGGLGLVGLTWLELDSKPFVTRVRATNSWSEVVVGCSVGYVDG